MRISVTGWGNDLCKQKSLTGKIAGQALFLYRFHEEADLCQTSTHHPCCLQCGQVSFRVCGVW